MTPAMKIKEEKEIAVLADRISSIRIGKAQLNTELMMNMFHLDEDQLTEILSLLDKYPDKDEWALAEMILYK